jgi:hypothetical protein
MLHCSHKRLLHLVATHSIADLAVLPRKRRWYSQLELGAVVTAQCYERIRRVYAKLYVLQAQKLLAGVKGGGSAWEAVLQDARQSKVCQHILLTNLQLHAHVHALLLVFQSQTTRCDLVVTAYVPVISS